MRELTAQSRVIGRKYHVVKSLGKGATSVVYLVRLPAGTPLALKYLRDLNKKLKNKAIENFENEFIIRSQIYHPNIAPIFDFSLDRRHNKVFFTMPFIDGVDLGQYTLNASYAECLDLFYQIAEALSFIHEQEITHGDLKPQNILVKDSHVYLIDFGYANHCKEEATGTPLFMAPELFEIHTHTPKSDLYALGVVMYYCLTRQFPFSGKTHAEIIRNICSTRSVEPRTIKPDLPKSMNEMIMKLMSKEAKDRYASACEVKEMINREKSTV